MGADPVVGIARLHRMIKDRGKAINKSVLRYHCQHGSLSSVAYKVGDTWVIPLGAATRFANDWTPQPGGRKPQ